MGPPGPVFFAKLEQSFESSGPDPVALRRVYASGGIKGLSSISGRRRFTRSTDANANKGRRFECRILGLSRQADRVSGNQPSASSRDPCAREDGRRTHRHRLAYRRRRRPPSIRRYGQFQRLSISVSARAPRGPAAPPSWRASTSRPSQPGCRSRGVVRALRPPDLRPAARPCEVDRRRWSRAGSGRGHAATPGRRNERRVRASNSPFMARS